eukprot:g2031.t1
MSLGFLVGCMVRALQLEQEEALLNFRGSFFFYVLLPPIILEAGLSLKTQLFVDNLGSIMAFAVVGTLVSTWVVSASMRWAAETELIGNTIPKIPQAAAGSGPTYVGVQDPAVLRSPQRSNRSLSKASSPCLLNDCASNRSSPASSLYRRQSSDLATESLPALPPTETPRQLLPQQAHSKQCEESESNCQCPSTDRFQDTLDISFGLGTQGHEAEAARAAPSSPAEKPPAEPAEA